MLVWSAAMTAVFKVIGVLVPLRVRQEDEVMVLDVSLHGEALIGSAPARCRHFSTPSV